MHRLQTKKLNVEVPGKVLCRDLELSVQAGEIWCVLGRNGTGKTTLLHSLAGLHLPSSGSILLDGTPLLQIPRSALARRLGILFQDHSDPFPATVLETVLIGRHPHLGLWDGESTADYKLAYAALKTVGLEKFSEREVDSLSGGERRRVGIATLLVQQPNIYLWDEPTNHLDLHHQVQILTHLHNMAKQHGSTHIMVLHDLNLASRFADHFLLLMDNGEYHAGTAAEVLQQDILEQVYQHALVSVKGPAGTAWLPGCQGKLGAAN